MEACPCNNQAASESWGSYVEEGPSDRQRRSHTSHCQISAFQTAHPAGSQVKISNGQPLSLCCSFDALQYCVTNLLQFIPRITKVKGLRIRCLERQKARSAYSGVYSQVTQ